MGAGISSSTLEMVTALPPTAAAPSPTPIAIGATVVTVDPRTVIAAAPSPAPIAIGAIVVAVDPRTVIAAAPSPSAVPPTGLFDKSVSLPVNGILG